MRRGQRAFLLVAAATLACVSSAHSTALGPAPKGFSWKQMHEIKAAFLMPDGWHFKHEVKGNTLAYFISKENIDREGRFETGLTLNVVRGLTSVTADKYAKEFIATLASRNELLRNWEIRVGTFTGYGCQVKAAPGPGRPAVIIHELAIANTRTNTLYILLFESPEATWGNEWEKGRVMTEAFALDDEV